MEIRPKPNQKHILRKNGSLLIETINTEPSLAQQQFKEQSDVNNIIKYHLQTGTDLPVSKKIGQFMDVSNVTEYQSALETVFEAQKAFDNLPASVRTKFENDPNKLIDFLSIDSNAEEAFNLGLTTTKPKSNDQTQTNEPKSKQTSQSKPASDPQGGTTPT